MVQQKKAKRPFAFMGYGVLVGAAKPNTISDHPKKIMLIPTISPIAQIPVCGHPLKMINARQIEMMPLTKIHPHEGRGRLLSETKILAIPSIMKKMARIMVSVRAPAIGFANRMIPTIIDRTGAINDVQNPGSWRVCSTR